jgi:hypothetical protein
MPLEEKFPVFYTLVRFGYKFHTGAMNKILLYNSESLKNRCIECHTLLRGVNEFLAEKLSLNAIVAQLKNWTFGVNSSIYLKNTKTCDNTSTLVSCNITR